LSTYQTWKEVIPEQSYKENKGEQMFRIKSGNNYSQIFYGGVNDKNDTVSKFKSSEFAFEYIDQAEELIEQDFLDLLQRLRQKLPSGEKPPYQAIFTANPKICTFRQRFIVNPKDGIQKFIPALPTDNPYLASDYVPRMRELYKYRPEMIKALLEGNWDVVEEANAVFHQKWIDTCMNISDARRWVNKKGVSVDAARFGDDESVIFGWHGTKQIDRDIFGKQDEHVVAARAWAMLKKIGGNWIAVGGGAIGKTVRAKLRLIVDSDVQIIDVDEVAPADDRTKYYNVRAEMYWETAELAAETALALIPDPETARQFMAHTYSYSGGRILIDDKEDIKEKINRSPDYADAICIGVWAMKRAPEMPAYSTVQMTSTQKAIKEAMHEKREVGSYFDTEA
jgi:hypothetical protein